MAVRSSPAASCAFDGNTMRMPGRVREDRDARLAVIRRAAAQVAADRHADDHRARPVVVRAVAHHRHLVANLHEAGPDVVEELDLDDRLQAAQRHADAAADDVGFGERRVEDAVAAELPLQTVRHLEDAALALDRRQRRFVAGIGDVLAEDDDARIARHLVAQRRVDGAHHRLGGRRCAAARWRASSGRRIDVGREHVERRRVRIRLGRGERGVRGLR